MDFTITAQEILSFAALIGAVGAIWAVVSKPFKELKSINDRLDKLDAKMVTISRAVEIQGDMVYQLLDHAATNNNTGEMQRALNQYNATFRHGGNA